MFFDLLPPPPPYVHETLISESHFDQITSLDFSQFLEYWYQEYQTGKIVLFGPLLGQFKNLKTLDLREISEEQFYSMLPYFEELNSLQVLNLSECEFIDDLFFLSSLTKLEELHLEGTAISDVSALKGLSRLKVLNVADCNLSIFSHLHNLPSSLISLDIQHNPIIDTSFLERLKLQTLNLSDTSVYQLPSSQALSEIENLDLSGTNISDLTILKETTKLKRLKLKNTHIEDADYFAISTLQNLEDLTLPNLCTQDQFDMAVGPLRNLKKINVPVDDYSALIDKSLENLKISSSFYLCNQTEKEPFYQVIKSPNLHSITFSCGALCESLNSNDLSYLSKNLVQLKFRAEPEVDFSYFPKLPNLIYLKLDQIGQINHGSSIKHLFPNLESFTCINGEFLEEIPQICQELNSLKNLTLEVPFENQSLTFLNECRQLKTLTLDFFFTDANLIRESFFSPLYYFGLSTQIYLFGLWEPTFPIVAKKNSVSIGFPWLEFILRKKLIDPKQLQSYFIQMRGILPL